VKSRSVLLISSGICQALIFIQGGIAATAPFLSQINVSLPTSFQDDAAGRLLVFAKPVTPNESTPSDEVDSSESHPASVAVAGTDVATFGAGRSVSIDLDRVAAPMPFSALPPGDYRVQAVLDRDGDYGRFGRGAGDIVSNVMTIHLPLDKSMTIGLDHVLPTTDLWDFPNVPPETRARRAAAHPFLTDVKIPSPLLTQFWGRPVSLVAWVLVPPRYVSSGKLTWPVIYMSGTFSANHERDLDVAVLIAQLNQAEAIPPMIWVFLNCAEATGATEFADGVNNGPWGQALTAELIPVLEKRFRMDARPTGRLLMGHSSGGWASLWLQVNYPDLFGGAWATAPDPSDFQDFVGVDLYAPHANVYIDEGGALRPLVRAHGQVTATIKDFVGLEEVLGHIGGTFQSFDWVFSPRGPDGRPLPMFDRITGAVDPSVVTYWRNHYDIAHLIASLPTAGKRKIDGKLRVIVGDADTFYLDGSAHRLQAVTENAGVKAEFRFLPGKTHNDLYLTDGDPLALLKDIARVMFAVARPK
jgi:S-formylglutathione hydrolase FrmB